MIRFLLPFLLFLMLLGESVFVDLMPSEQLGIERLIIPHFVMIALIMVGIYLGRLQAVYYGIGFGFLFDLIYIDILGIYLFLFPVIAYIMSYVRKVLHTNLFIVLFTSIIGVAILELFVYGIYYLIAIHQMPFEQFLFQRLFPTLVLNGVFFILIFYPFRKLLLRLSDVSKQD